MFVSKGAVLVSLCTDSALWRLWGSAAHHERHEDPLQVEQVRILLHHSQAQEIPSYFLFVPTIQLNLPLTPRLEGNSVSLITGASCPAPQMLLGHTCPLASGPAT